MTFTRALRSCTSRANLVFNSPAKSVPLHSGGLVNLSTSYCNATHTSIKHVHVGLSLQVSPAALL